MHISLDERCAALASELGLGRGEDICAITPLSGGVASDIALVELPSRRVCLKFALEKLRVAKEWHAPVHRNLTEYRWLQVAADVVPLASPRLFGHSTTENGFAMEYVEGDDVYLWKDATMARQGDQGEAAAVGRVIGQIHAVSTKPGFDRAPFSNNDDFEALRLEPYLRYTAKLHPAIAGALNTLADGLYSSHKVLLHGDVSPKNILFRNRFPIILDAECATMGDAAFDVAFCMTHLVLGAVHHREIRAAQIGAVEKLWKAYAPLVTWEETSSLEARICALLPAFMLARIDGKSPVEYLTQAKRQAVRDISVPLIETPKTTLRELASVVKIQFGNL